MNPYTILNNFDIESNFWEENPHFLLFNPFRTFHKNDKSRKKDRSSRVMWSIALLVHPKSKFADSDYDRRKEIIVEDYLKFEDISFDKKYSELIEVFKEEAMTRKQTVYVMWGDKLNERMKMLSETKYTMENTEDLDKAMARTSKIWDMYIIAGKDMESEESQSQVQGGEEESAEEKGIL